MSIARKCDICGSFYDVPDLFYRHGILLRDKDGLIDYTLCRAEDNPEDGSKSLVQYDLCDKCANDLSNYIQSLSRKDS